MLFPIRLLKKIGENFKERGVVLSLIHFKRQILRRIKYRGLDLWNIVDQNMLDAPPEIKEHGKRYEATKPYIFSEVFKNINWDFSTSTFIDFGCGKGAVLAYASEYGFKNIIGIEHSYQLCIIAERNMKLFLSKKRNNNIEVIQTDASSYIIPIEADCFYFFNPFDESILDMVIQNILKSLQISSRNILIIYVNSVHNELFLKYSFKEIKRISTELLDNNISYMVNIYVNS